MLRKAFCFVPFLFACATTSPNVPNLPASVPYVVNQITFHHGSSVACGPDVGPPSPAMVSDAIDSTVAAFAEAKRLAPSEVQSFLEKYKPTIYIVDAIDCAKAHGGAGCGGFIASDNTVHIRGVADGCLASTSLVHFLLHYLVGCQSGAMDIDHQDGVFKDIEASINLHVAQKCVKPPATTGPTG